MCPHLSGFSCDLRALDNFAGGRLATVTPAETFQRPSSEETCFVFGKMAAPAPLLIS